MERAAEGYYRGRAPKQGGFRHRGFGHLLTTAAGKAGAFFKSQPVLVIAFIAAVVTMFFVPPDAQYLGYCNFGVLAELFALMIAVAGLKSAGIFEKLTSALLKKAGSVRRLAQIFTLLCFFLSMLVTNDVALITFVPLTLLTFSAINDDRARIITIVLETAAANLGSMMTPIGNPQNLYIYDEYGLSAGEFIMTMLPAGIISLVCLLLLTLLVPKTACKPAESGAAEISKKLAVIYAILFAVCVITVFKLLPFWVCAAAAIAAAVIFDRKLLLKADYALLATFICFFVFVGNIARIDAVHDFFSGIMAGREILVSALLSQGISNVPAAVMLRGFTANGTALLAGVNIGGLGTPIASMASLISLQFYRKAEGAHSARYLAVFSAVNFAMLALLLAVYIVLIR
ncbi:MAG: citrate transporter [Ruminiclostridium sp.]|nr:citrate transporter [Ruminiclostridium sp.]